MSAADRATEVIRKELADQHRTWSGYLDHGHIRNALTAAGLLVADDEVVMAEALRWLVDRLRSAARSCGPDEEMNDAEQAEHVYASMLLAGLDKRHPAAGRALREAQS